LVNTLKQEIEDAGFISPDNEKRLNMLDSNNQILIDFFLHCLDSPNMVLRTEGAFSFEKVTNQTLQHSLVDTLVSRISNGEEEFVISGLGRSLAQFDLGRTLIPFFRERITKEAKMNYPSSIPLAILLGKVGTEEEKAEYAVELCNLNRLDQIHFAQRCANSLAYLKPQGVDEIVVPTLYGIMNTEKSLKLDVAKALAVIRPNDIEVFGFFMDLLSHFSPSVRQEAAKYLAILNQV